MPAPAPPPPSSPAAPVRIAIALLRYFPHGGLQRIAVEVALELQRRGHHVRIFTQDWKGPRPAPHPGGDGTLNVELLDVKGLSNHARAADFGGALARTLKDAPADVVLGFDRLPGLDVYFAGDPCYSARIRRDRHWLQRFTPRARTFLKLERSVFGADSRARVLLMDGREQAIIQAEYGTQGERFRVLPPGFSATRRQGPDAHEQRARIRSELGAEDAFLALALGSDFHRKGFDRAVRGLLAASQHAAAQRPPQPKPVLAIAGSGDDRRLKELTTKLGLGEQMRWLGARDDVPALLQGADLLVHPCRSEPAGMVLLEALSAGIPVLVAGAAGYASHVAASGAGAVLPEPFDQPALDHAWIRIMSEPGPGLQEQALRYTAALDPLGMVAAVADEVAARVQRA